jgi:peptidoglycan/LPS O-acetylase OafA/YrhL
MAILLLGFGAVILFADDKGKKTELFDLESTTCMRGLWCIVILLVHVPLDYQNVIQDAIGSFAYIGVTFFFMTSGYGLTLGAKRNPQKALDGFWKRRLPKLLVPMVIVNVARFIASIFAFKKVMLLELVSITGFVRQLLFFYLVFWAVMKFLPDRISVEKKCGIICGCVFVFSIVVYFWSSNPVFAWPVESFGFAYGLLLALYKDSLINVIKNKWLLKSIILGCVSLLLGVAYLKFKSVYIIGDYFVRIALGVAILLFIFLLNSKFKIGNKVSRFLGEISYEVYLIHDVVFMVLATVYAKMNSGIFVVSSIFFTVLLSVSVNRLSKVILCRKN